MLKETFIFSRAAFGSASCAVTAGPLRSRIMVVIMVLTDQDQPLDLQIKDSSSLPCYSLTDVHSSGQTRAARVTPEVTVERGE